MGLESRPSEPHTAVLGSLFSLLNDVSAVAASLEAEVAPLQDELLSRAERVTWEAHGRHMGAGRVKVNGNTQAHIVYHP